jgi:NADH-quinone oxidoreductase subunit I
MKDCFQQIKDLFSLIVGLFVTGDNLRRRTVTVHYPRRQVDNLASFRGPIQLLPSDKDPSVPRCISCMMCMNTCPSGCLTVIKQKAPEPSPAQQQAMAEAKARGEKVKKPPAPKNPAAFIYDFSLCSLCGLCVEVCPANAIGFSSDAYMVVRRRDSLKLDLLARMAAGSGCTDYVKEVA